MNRARSRSSLAIRFRSMAEPCAGVYGSGAEVVVADVGLVDPGRGRPDDAGEVFRPVGVGHAASSPSDATPPELARTGYAGRVEPGFLRPHAYIELHVKQRPVLELEVVAIGAVESPQGIS